MLLPGTKQLQTGYLNSLFSCILKEKILTCENQLTSVEKHSRII